MKTNFMKWRTYKVKKILLFVLILTISAFSQPYWTQGEDVSNTNGNYFLASDADSVFFDDDTLYIVGVDTAYIWVNSGKTLGMITFKGHVTTKDTIGHSGDSARVVFEMAKLTGMNYNTSLDANVTETFYALDSVEVDSGTVGAFYFKPFDNTNLDQVHTNYWILRIRNKYATNLSAIIIREERIRAY